METIIADHEEIIDCGAGAGLISVYELTGEAFNNACLQRNSTDCDNTGLKIHAGAHVAIRFIRTLKGLLNERRVVELGTGIGIVGLSVARTCNAASLVLTDGNPNAIAITNKNIFSTGLQDQIHAVELSWGHVSPDFRCGLHETDVVLGCELMYYKTDVRSLVETVSDLLASDGIFIHAHHFRKEGLDSELADVLAEFGYETVECAPSMFLTSAEQSDHPEWLKIRCLISGRSDFIANIRLRYNYLKSFVPGTEGDGSESDDVDEPPEITLDAAAMLKYLS